jgi:hypothetical protein
MSSYKGHNQGFKCLNHMYPKKQNLMKHLLLNYELLHLPHIITIPYSTLPYVGSRGGVLTAWKEDYTLNTSYSLTFSNTTLLTNSLNSFGFSFMVTNVYGPTANNLKTDFITELRMIACLHDLPWLLLGDFNILRDPAESTSTNPNTHGMVEFNEMIIDLQMKEIPLYGRSFTWSNMLPNPSLSWTKCCSHNTGTP